jgi:small subunit ribosomal protein S1
MDGLIHISELSWSHVNHPSEVLEIGQDVKVKVLDIDRDRQRISLGLKQTQSDPWQQVVESYSEGDVVQGRVTKVVTFGAFVEILPGVEGLVHISELAQHHVENPREVVSQGQAVNVLILEIDAERRRLSLSLKRVEDGAAPRPRPGEEAERPSLDLSEDVFSESSAAVEETADEAVDAGDETDPAAVLESLPVESLSAGPAAAAAAIEAEEEEPAAVELTSDADELEPVAEAAVVEDEPVAEVEVEVEDEPVAEVEEEPVAEIVVEGEPVAEVELDEADAVEDEPLAQAAEDSTIVSGSAPADAGEPDDEDTQS